MPAKLLRRRATPKATEEPEKEAEPEKTEHSSNRRDSTPAATHWMLKTLVGGKK